MHKTPSNYVQQTLQRQREVQKHFWGKLKKKKKKKLIHNSSISFLGMALKLKPFLDLLTEQTIRLNRWLRNTGGHPHKVFAMSRCGNLEIQMCKWSESNCMNLDWPQRQTEYASKHQYMDLLVMCSQENSILKKIMKTSCEPHIVDVPGSKQEKKLLLDNQMFDFLLLSTAEKYFAHIDTPNRNVSFPKQNQSLLRTHNHSVNNYLE